MASGYNFSACDADARLYMGLGYSPNSNPGTGYCVCHSGFNGFMVVGPPGNGPLGTQGLTPEQVQMYDAGMLHLREKYQLDAFAAEHEQLLQSIAPVVPVPEN